MNKTRRWTMFSAVLILALLTVTTFVPGTSSRTIGNFLIGQKKKQVPQDEKKTPVRTGKNGQARPTIVEVSDGLPQVEDAEDPDLPPGFAGRIDKAEYLRARGDNIDMLRGRDGDAPTDAREEAIKQLERQQGAMRRLVSQGLAGPVNTTNWVPLGPAPIPLGQTSTTRVNVSGRTIAIAVHPTDANIVYVGTAQGGLYKSTDGGAHWAALFDFQ